MSAARPLFYEFFAGGGMARAGLGTGWHCSFANDIDPAKAAVYARNGGADVLHVGDIAALTPDDLPGTADLAWASFPCQDLSVAGAGQGLAGTRSGLIHAFCALMAGLRTQGRAPRLIALENVTGLLSRRGGADFTVLTRLLADLGYRVGALTIDAERFTPQSRPRVFVVAARGDLALDGVTAAAPSAWAASPALRRAVAGLSVDLAARHVWWRIPEPPRRNTRLIDLIEAEPGGVRWHSPVETQRLLSLMVPLHRARVEAAQRSGDRSVGAVYRRTRPGPDGVRRQRAEVRFDGLAGCLRTPAGGSSRQTLLLLTDGAVRSRLISPREAARLMGLPEDYVLPERYTDACHLVGDGLCVPAVAWIARHLLDPLIDVRSRQAA